MVKKVNKKQNKQSRPPIVGIFGHIDHGKTTLLDKIRQTSVAASEAGGITQRVSAYQVTLADDGSELAGKKITFLDTPGHAAFIKMRSCGVGVIDLAILVVAATEGIKPQTRECLKFIQKAKVPFLVVANKMDLPEANLEMVKNQLAKEGALVEGLGGEVVVVPVSAKTGKGIKELLEMILLLAQMEGVGAQEGEAFEAVVIDSYLDSREGIQTLAVVRKGTLILGDYVWAQESEGKIKALIDDRGKRVEKAVAGSAVKILGFKSLPAVGAVIRKEKMEEKMEKEKVSILTKAQEPATEEAAEEKVKRLRIILKADSQATLEAILANLPNNVEVMSLGVGNINDGDVLLAQTVKARIFGFKVKITPEVKKLVETEKVSVVTFEIIYELLDRLAQLVEKLEKPGAEEEILGEAKIIAQFEARKERVAGGQMQKGRIARGDTLHLLREGKLVGNVRIKSLQKGKEIVDKVVEENEFGVVISPSLDFAIGDMLVSFRKSA